MHTSPFLLENIYLQWLKYRERGNKFSIGQNYEICVLQHIHTYIHVNCKFILQLKSQQCVSLDCMCVCCFTIFTYIQDLEECESWQIENMDIEHFVLSLALSLRCCTTYVCMYYFWTFTSFWGECVNFYLLLYKSDA